MARLEAQGGAAQAEIRACKECFHEHQLAITRRSEATGEPRRRQRGELKMLQRARLVDICSYLTLPQLFNFSRVSSDFYFVSRDNELWVAYNAARWVAISVDGGSNGAPNSWGGSNRVLSSSTNTKPSSPSATPPNAAALSTAPKEAATPKGAAAAGDDQDEVAKRKVDAPLAASSPAPNRPTIDTDLGLQANQQSTEPRSPSHTIDSSMMTAANAEFSSHSSYNFTQFLQYCFALETSRCMGFANFANSAKQLLSKAIKIAVIGPAGVGKSTLIQTFLQVGGGGQLAGVPVGSSPVSAPGSGGFESAVGHTRSNTYTGGVSPARGGGGVAGVPQSTAYRPTAGLVVSQKRVAVRGGLIAPQSCVTLFDVGGDQRYEMLRGLIGRSVHAVILCYDVTSKESLVQAAVQMSQLEPFLGPQPVIVCGIIPPSITSSTSSRGGSKTKEVTPEEAGPTSARCRASIQISTHSPSEPFALAVQAVLEKLMAGGRPAAEMMHLTQTPSALDVLLDLKV